MFRDLLTVFLGEVGGDLLQEILFPLAHKRLAALPGVRHRQDWERALTAAAAARRVEAAKLRDLLGESWKRDSALGEIAFAIDADPGRDFAEVVRYFDWFSASIRPKQLHHFNGKPEQYLARIQAFASRLHETEAGICDHIRRTVPGQIKGREQRFFEKIPVDRLRTFDDLTLRDVAGHFLDWDPVVEALEQNNSRAVDLADRTFREALGVNVSNSHAQGDKVNEAWLRVKWRDPWSGYCYESPLDAWLITVARNWQRDEDRHVRPFVEWINRTEGDEELPRHFSDRAPTPEDIVIRRDLGERWKHLAEFVESTFQKEPNRLLARVLACGDFDEMPDEALVDLLNKKTTYSYSVRQLRMTRFRFNQRMAVLPGRPTEGYDSLPMLRQLKAFFDNFPPLGTRQLGRALLACCVFRDPAFRDHWLATAKQWMGEFEDLETSYGFWTSSNALPGVGRLRYLALVSGVAFALETCWYLMVGEARSIDDVAERFDADCRPAVRALADPITQLNRRGRESYHARQ